MKPVKLDDDWVRSQLVEKFPFPLRLRYKLKFFWEKVEPILRISGFSVPLVSISLSTEIIADLIRKEIKEEKTFIGHSKILESRGLGSVARNMQSVIDGLPDFQAYIYATDEFYRDHIEHQIRVAVLGNFLLSQRFNLGTEETRLVNIVSSNMNYSRTGSNINEEDVRKAWWVASLFHDIGMPVEKLARNFNKVLKSDLAEAYQDLNLNVPEINDPIPDEDRNRSFFEVLTEGFSRPVQRKLKMALGWEREAKVDHGAVSALFLLKSIPDITSSDTREIKDFLESKYQPYLIAAKAILLHNLYQEDNCVEIDSLRNPLAYLLICCDEMQEWGREVNIKDRRLLDPRFRKVQLVERSLLEMFDREVKLSFKYKNQKAKDMCRFAFDYYFSDKEKNIGRLENNSNAFPKLTIKATDFVYDKGKLIQTVEKETSTNT